MALCVWIAFKAFEHVVGLQAQLGGALGCGYGAHAAAAEHQNFVAGRHAGDEAGVKAGVQGHAGPLFPGQGQGAGHKADPLAFGVRAHVHQHTLAVLHPLPGQVGQNVAGVACSRQRATLRAELVCRSS